MDEAQIEAGLGHQARFHTPRGANEEHLGMVALNQFEGHRERGNDVAASAAAGNENAQLGQEDAFQKDAREEQDERRPNDESLACGDFTKGSHETLHLAAHRA